MELVEITNLIKMDIGAPSLTMMSTEYQLFITFYADRENTEDILQSHLPVDDTTVYTLKFSGYLKYSSGFPDNESIYGHPYHKLGMESYAFYELKNSDLLMQLEEINKAHPYYNPEKWKKYKHFIITFHDSMFECIAEHYEIRKDNISIYDSTKIILNELNTKIF